MTEELAKKISELYKQKSELSDKISKLTDENNIIFGITYRTKDYFHSYGLPYIEVEFIKELKEFTLNKLKEQLLKVEEDLRNINCSN